MFLWSIWYIMSARYLPGHWCKNGVVSIISGVSMNHISCKISILSGSNHANKFNYYVYQTTNYILETDAE